MIRHLTRAGILFPLAMLSVMTFTGCVSRRLTIRSDPPGALLEVDGERVGYTPMSIDFTYYATREISLSKVGYEPLTVQQPIPAPWLSALPVGLRLGQLFADAVERIVMTSPTACSRRRSSAKTS